MGGEIISSLRARGREGWKCVCVGEREKEKDLCLDKKKTANFLADFSVKTGTEYRRSSIQGLCRQSNTVLVAKGDNASQLVCVIVMHCHYLNILLLTRSSTVVWAQSWNTRKPKRWILQSPDNLILVLLLDLNSKKSDNCSLIQWTRCFEATTDCDFVSDES